MKEENERERRDCKQKSLREQPERLARKVCPPRTNLVSDSLKVVHGLVHG